MQTWVWILILVTLLCFLCLQKGVWDKGRGNLTFSLFMFSIQFKFSGHFRRKVILSVILAKQNTVVFENNLYSLNLMQMLMLKFLHLCLLRKRLIPLSSVFALTEKIIECKNRIDKMILDKS